MKLKVYDLLIVGAGPSGLYSGFLAGLKSIDAVILESASEIGGQPGILYPEKEIYDIPGYESIKASDLIVKLHEQLKKYENIEIKLNTILLNIFEEEDYFKVETNKDIYYAKYILMAHGGGEFSPRKLDVSGYIGQENICYFVQDTNEFIKKEIVILGGGNSAVDWANELKGNSNVTIIHRSDTFRAHSRQVDKLSNGVKIYKPYKVVSIKGDPAEEILIENINTKEQVTVKTDVMCVFYGMVKQRSTISELFDSNREGILVNRFMETSVDKIFAVGNACSYEGKAYIITSAFGEAANAMQTISSRLYPNRIQTFSSLRREK